MEKDSEKCQPRIPSFLCFHGGNAWFFWQLPLSEHKCKFSDSLNRKILTRT